MRWDSVAFDLLCSIVRPRPDLDKAREILKEGVDIDVLFSLAARHGVRPRLSVLLPLGLDPAAERSLRAALATFERDHVARSLAMVDELVRVTGALAVAAIPVVAFKGPVLALQLYDGLAQREYADIDLLVPPDRADAAQALLATLGYRNIQGDAAFVRTFLGAQRQVALDRPGLAAAIDLHWAFSAAPLPFPLDSAEIWPRLVPLSIGGRPVPTLAPDDLALLLAGHGTKEAWHNLAWVADFARLVDRHPELDWADLLQWARRRRCGDAVLLAAAMAQRLLGVEPPRGLAAPLAASRRVGAQADRLAEALRQGAAEGPREHLHDILLCDRLADRLWARVRTALRPTAGDHAALPLPRPLWPLYWLTRPFRLAARTIRRC